MGGWYYQAEVSAENNQYGTFYKSVSVKIFRFDREKKQWVSKTYLDAEDARRITGLINRGEAWIAREQEKEDLKRKQNEVPRAILPMVEGLAEKLVV